MALFSPVNRLQTLAVGIGLSCVRPVITSASVSYSGVNKRKDLISSQVLRVHSVSGRNDRTMAPRSQPLVQVFRLAETVHCLAG